MKTDKPIFPFAKALIMMLLAVTVINSCKKAEITDGKTDEIDEIDEIIEETVTYEIKSATSKFYTVSAPDKSEPGMEIEVTVTPVENVFVNALLFNGIEADEKSENTFVFEMPQESVDLEVLTSSIITLEPSSYFEVSADKEIAAVGETVTVTFETLYATDIVSTALVNGTMQCKPVSADIGEYIFSFTMPEGPAHVTGYTASEYFVIEREWDDHCQVVMLDCINNQGEPDEFCSQITGGLVHFLYKWDLGFEVKCRVIGKTTGTDYTGEVFWSLAEDNHLYQDCWAFYMPEEPVVIKAESTEIGTYRGEDFVGEYKAYWITLGTNRIFTSETPTMKMELRESSAYFVTSTDDNAYDFSGLYSVNGIKISSDRENARGNYSLSGDLLEDDFAFIIVDDILVNKADNRRYYLAGKNDFRYTCASDSDYGKRFLIETEADGQRKHYFVDIEVNSLTAVTADFQNGSSISGTSTAIFTKNGKDYLKYTYQDGSIPEFKYCGKEAGSYTSTSGGATLVLDGFGSATYNGTRGTYTIESGVVTFTDSYGTVTRFNIDMNRYTFTEIKPAETSKLYPVYSTKTAYLYLGSGDPVKEGYVEIRFNSGYDGKTKEGYASVKIWYMEYGTKEELVGTSNPFIFDEANRTVTITQVLQGTGSGWSTTRKDMVLNISQDYKTLYFADEVIYSTSTPYEYIYGGTWSPINYDDGSTEPEPEPETGWKGPKTYTASGLTGQWEGNASTGGVVQLLMDEDMYGNKTDGKAIVVAYVDDTNHYFSRYSGNYDFNESTSTLTVRQIPVGLESGGYGYVDISFIVSADKSYIQFAESFGERFNAPWNDNTYIEINGIRLIGE